MNEAGNLLLSIVAIKTINLRAKEEWDKTETEYPKHCEKRKCFRYVNINIKREEIKQNKYLK
jgi:hypothetical protein